MLIKIGWCIEAASHIRKATTKETESLEIGSEGTTCKEDRT